MAVGETPGQGCWNTPRIVEYFVTWHMMEWLFRRLFPASGGPVCFLQSETIIQTKRRYFTVFAWRNSYELLEPLWQPWPGISPTAILNEENALETRLPWQSWITHCACSLRHCSPPLSSPSCDPFGQRHGSQLWISDCGKFVFETDSKVLNILFLMPI